MDKNIPLSELIRIGSRQSGQCYEKLVDENGQTCALGAALLAKKGEISMDDNCGGIEELQLPRINVMHPVTGGIRFVEIIIISLNDEYGWSREGIARWLESISL